MHGLFTHRRGEQQGIPQKKVNFYSNLKPIKTTFQIICAMFDLGDTMNTGNPQFTRLLFHLHNRVGL